MSFNFPWTNRKNNQDYVFAEDVNALAGGIRMAGSHAENVLAAHKQSADHDVRYYTKQQSCDRFANALIGSTIGSTIALTDIQPGATEARELTIYGKTVETGTGDKSPDNPYTITGVGESGTVPIVVSDGTNSQTVDVPVSAPLYSLPNGVRDELDVSGGRVIRSARKVVLDGTEGWSIQGQSGGDVRRFDASVLVGGAPVSRGKIHCDKFASDYGSYDPYEHVRNGDRNYPATLVVYINKSRIPGWDDAWTNIQRISAFKTWLTSNPITVLYELAEPIIETIPPIDIPLYYPDCTITTTDEVEPEMRVAYNRDLNATLQALQDAIETITGG